VFGEWDNVFAEIEKDLVEKFRFQPETAMPNPDETDQSLISDPPPIQVPVLQDIVNVNSADAQPTSEQFNDQSNS
jgi:hypothetical protein